MSILDKGRNLTLRPMQYPIFHKKYRDSIANRWTVNELDFSVDLEQLHNQLTEPQRKMINRLVAFFATADNIVAENLVINLYQNVNCPEYRMYLGQQLAEEMMHVDTYLLLVDNYIPNKEEQKEAFDAYLNIPSIKMKADFAIKYMDSINEVGNKKEFVKNLICFATCIEGLFFYGAFAYVYFLRSKGLLPGLGTATEWIFRDESMHMSVALDLIEVLKKEEPELFDNALELEVKEMLKEALSCELQFAKDALSEGVLGLPLYQMEQYLKFIVDERCLDLGYSKIYNESNPFPFTVLNQLKSHTNFFESRVTDYQKNIDEGTDEDQF